MNKMGFWGEAPEILQHFINFGEFLQNHHKKIFFVLLSKKFGGGNID